MVAALEATATSWTRGFPDRVLPATCSTSTRPTTPGCGAWYRAFTPPRIAALEPAIQDIADRLLDELDAAARRHGRSRRGLRLPPAVQVIGELLGIPAPDRPRLHAWFGVLLTGWAGDPPPAAVEASDGIALAWAHGDGLVLRGLTCLPVVLQPR